MKILHEYTVNGKRIVYADYTEEEIKQRAEMDKKSKDQDESNHITNNNDK